MSKRTSTIVGLMALALLFGLGLSAPAADEAVDKAFDALKTYDWGTDRNVLKPIDDAVVASHGDAGARKALETRLAAVLKTDASRAAKDFVCRKLSLIGTAACVPTVAELFDTGSHGVLFGIILFCGTVGGAISPLLGGTIFDLTGSYQTLFLILTGVTVIGFVMIIMLRPLQGGDVKLD